MEINQQGYINEWLTSQQTSSNLISKRRFKEARERNENTAKDKSNRHDDVACVQPKNNNMSTRPPDPQTSRVSGKGSDPGNDRTDTETPGTRFSKIPIIFHSRKAASKFRT